MWGEKWGEMIWGIASAAPVQIPFGPWALIALGFVLGVCAVYANRSRMARVVPFVMVLLVPMVSVIAVNLPHTFSNGTIADADQVNDNFSAIASSINQNLSSVEASAPGNAILTIVSRLDHTNLTALCSDAGGCRGRLCRDNPVGSPSLSVCDDFILRYLVADSTWSVLRNNVSNTLVDNNSDTFTMNNNSCLLTDADSWSLTSGYRDNNLGLSVANTTSSPTTICSVVISD